jgi:hypothetical protein
VARAGVTTVGGIDAFDVLYRIDLVLRLRYIQMRRKRQVQHDACDGRVFVERLNRFGQRAAVDRRGEFFQFVPHAHRFARPALAGRVKLGIGGVADENRREMGLEPPLGEHRHVAPNAFLYLLRQRFAVNDLRRHRGAL